KRSCPTIAIGHELSVTALQLALAYGAIANGGVLLEPMPVRETRDAAGSVRHTVSTRASRRVIGEAPARAPRDRLTAAGHTAAGPVPGVRLLPPAAAARRLRDRGLRARREGRGERVLARSPVAGEGVERGASVTAWLEGPADSAGGALPDLLGLPVREALRRL